MGMSAAALSVSIRSFNPFGTSIPKLVCGGPKPPLSPGMLREMAAAACLRAGLGVHWYLGKAGQQQQGTLSSALGKLPGLGSVLYVQHLWLTGR